MKSSFPPFRNWKSLTMSANERKKLIMSITFHIIALGTVVWSLYVLIGRRYFPWFPFLINIFAEKTQQELQEGDMKWAFWAKLIVVGVGFTGGLVFMYVQVSSIPWKLKIRELLVSCLRGPNTPLQKRKQSYLCPVLAVLLRRASLKQSASCSTRAS